MLNETSRFRFGSGWFRSNTEGDKAPGQPAADGSPKVNDASIGKSGSGENLRSDDGAFLQESFVCCKKK
ncbi:MAG: hypothetical protein ACI4O0_02380 [Candidatus Limivicinus sp.]